MKKGVWLVAVAAFAAALVLAMVLTRWSTPSSTAPTPSPAPTPTASEAGRGSRGDVRIAAVGDMNPKENTATNSPSGKNAAAIARAMADGDVDAFFGLGDFQYRRPRCEEYVDYWAKLWGRTKSKLYWVAAPNHDWKPGRN